jgi:nucleoside-diphosphate-sugar epimerase
MIKQYTVLITGGTGFLGSRIVTRLLAQGHKVIVIKRKKSKLDRLSGLLKKTNLSFFDYDDSLKKCFIENKIDFILHVATCYGRSSDSYTDVFLTNLVLPLELVELGLQHSVKAFINSDTFFNIKLGLDSKERSYITTKKLFLETATEVLKGKSLKFINMRIEQMYGPEDDEKKFVISILKDFLTNKSFLSLTKGGQKRDFIYVDDAAAAFIKVIDNYNNLKSFEEFGVGFGKSATIKNAVLKMKQLTGSSSKLKWGALPYRKNEIMDSFANIKANKKINWKPNVSFDDGLKLTIKKLTEKYGRSNG